MRITKNTKGFTLVELIIVITILAILGTIGFVSFQGYTADARDTKRTSDVSSLISALEAKRAGNSLSLVSFVDGSTNAEVTGTFTIAGQTPSATTYDAGIMNFSLLGVSAESFKDPNGFAYSFGATTLKGGQYQFAAVLENGETPTALVKGNYAPRTQTGITVIPSIRNDKMLEIKSTGDYSKILVNDMITNGSPTCNLAANTKVTSISSDLKYITISASPTTPVTTECQIQLTGDEVAGLIGDYSNSTPTIDTSNPVIDGSTTVLPY